MMMVEQLEGQEAFQSFLANLYGSVDSADPLQKIRKKSWERFLEIGLPNKKSEVFRYVPLWKFFNRSYEFPSSVELTQSDIEPHILPECQQSVAVFINGRYSSQHSRFAALPKKAILETIAEGMKTYGGFLTSQSTKSIKEESDPFAALNAAVYEDGLFLYLPPKTTFEVPLQLLNIIDAGSKQMLISPRIQLFAGMQSEIPLVSTIALLSGENYAFNMSAEFFLEEESHVRYIQAGCGFKKSIWHFDALRATLKKGSTLKTVNVSEGSETVRYDYRVNLAGVNSEALLNGVWMLSGKNEVHTHVLIDHQAPNCRSMQLFKGALSGASRSSFEGKILVRQAAQKTEAFQLNNNLLLSEGTHADSKPNLEIFADDVKASHGSTIGQLDNDQIFYMKTRGFSGEMAKNLMAYAFCQEVIEQVFIPSLRDRFCAVSDWEVV